jgi:DNA-binding GntR family transcriptional regulator
MIAKDSLPTKVFDILRDRIVHMEYPPGTNLSEKELCKEFKVSRTPLREAIRRLEEMRLVNAIPRYGTYVTSVDINEIRCAFEVKIRLERLAGEVAAKRITAEKLEDLKEIISKADALLNEGGHRNLIEIDTHFHEIIYQASQNPILQEFLENLHSRCARLWSSSLSEIIPVREIADQLREVYGALKDRDAKKAGQLMENHVQFFIDKIKNQLL